MPISLARVPTNRLSWGKGEQFCSLNQGSDLTRTVNNLIYEGEFFIADCSDENIDRLWSVVDVDEFETIHTTAMQILEGTYDG